MANIKIEPGSDLAKEQYAIVYAPGRNRDRFSETCVETVTSEDHAITGSNPESNQFPAKVVGPCRSSEGFRIYYLVNWLCDLHKV